MKKPRATKQVNYVVVSNGKVLASLGTYSQAMRMAGALARERPKLYSKSDSKTVCYAVAHTEYAEDHPLWPDKRANIRKTALAKLTEEEKEVLGL